MLGSDSGIKNCQKEQVRGAPTGKYGGCLARYAPADNVLKKIGLPCIEARRNDGVKDWPRVVVATLLLGYAKGRTGLRDSSPDFFANDFA